MSTYFMKQGDIFTPSSGNSRDIHEKLPGGNYLIKMSMFGPYFEMSPAFELPRKLYGHHEVHAERILKTFLTRKATTGALLAGDKGTGKTMVGKLVASKAAAMDIPTLIVNSPMTGDSFNSLLTAFEQPIILFLDEFEKVYDSEKQQELLTLMDGVFAGQRLFLLTTNDKWKVDSHMINRPGRIYYNLEYQGVEPDFIREYCIDHLRNKHHVDGVELLGTLFSEFNFDMLQAIVEEMNRYNENAAQVMKWLNCKMIMSKDDRFTVTMRIGDKVYTQEELHRRGIWTGNPMSDMIEIVYVTGKDKDGAPQYDEVDFLAADLVRMDVRSGEFIYQNADGARLKLKRNKSLPRGLDISNFVSKASVEEDLNLVAPL
jgi:hypothetical protein